jgi:hypothetical protein
MSSATVLTERLATVCCADSQLLLNANPSNPQAAAKAQSLGLSFVDLQLGLGGLKRKGFDEMLKVGDCVLVGPKVFSSPESHFRIGPVRSLRCYNFLLKNSNKSVVTRLRRSPAAASMETLPRNGQLKSTSTFSNLSLACLLRRHRPALSRGA